MNTEWKQTLSPGARNVLTEYFARVMGVIISDLERFNPWWRSQPGPELPRTRRNLVALMRRRLTQKLAPIVVLRGPRQIGKTTAQLHLIQDLLAEGIEPKRVFRVQFDEIEALSLKKIEDPILRLVDFYEKFALKESLNDAAHSGKPVFLFFDEIQNLKNWAPQLKSLVDNSTVQCVVTGSSALRIEQGRDSLAGRITTIDAGPLSLTEIGEFRCLAMPPPYLKDNGLDALLGREFWTGLREHGIRHKESRDEAFRSFSERGAYPIAHKDPGISWDQIAEQLNETVVKRVVEHDLRTGERGRKHDPQLIEEIFRLACRYAGQSPAMETLSREVNRTLGGNIGPQRARAILRQLSATLLIRLVEPLEMRLKKKSGAPKICLADHGLRASWLRERIPLAPDALLADPSMTDMAGRIAESATGALLSAIYGLGLKHFPSRKNEPEVDFVLVIGDKRIPLEVKYRRRIDPFQDTEGLRSFVEKAVYRAPFGLLITQTDDVTVDDPRIVTMPLSTLMMLR